MASRKQPKTDADLTEFGWRMRRALEYAKQTQTGAERAARIPKGYVSRLMYGSRGSISINPKHMDALARILGVSFEWLVLETGPMVARADYVPTTEKKKAHAHSIPVRRRVAGGM